MCKITMTVERTTKNTVRFTEVLEGKLTNPIIGTVYVPKDTLKAMGWKEGDDISLDISAGGKPTKGEKRLTAAEKATKKPEKTKAKVEAKAKTKTTAKKKTTKTA